jgi:flavin-dependent dehydrogenase
MPSDRYDVAVLGAGIAGLSACVLLRGQGLRVVCLDARPYPHSKVGESLDWSSPGLLARVGISSDSLLADRIATFKKKIVVSEIGREDWSATPPPQIRYRPLRFETVTLHVDRAALDNRLFEHARALGTEFIWERVSSVEHSAGRVNSLGTDSRRHVNARWYIDASGTARLFSRAMDIPVTFYGRTKVCLWTYFDTPPLYDGTAFFVDNSHDYLSWVWDIPISPTQTSVGFVLPADRVRDRRKGGASVEHILRDELRRHPRFARLLDAAPSLKVESTSFRPYVAGSVCGANWLMAGEAASMPDPLTGNGVTSGIRHARHAVEAILSAGPDDALSPACRRAYGRHVFRLGHSFNAHIERVVYRHWVRHGLGLQAATYVYTLFAFFTNALHARLDPRGRIAMAMFALWFAGARGWIAAWTMVSRAVLWMRPASPERAPASP